MDLKQPRPKAICKLATTSLLLLSCFSSPLIAEEAKDSLAPCPSSPNCVSSMAPQGDSHYVAPLTVKEDVDSGSPSEQILRVLDRMKRVRVIEKSPSYIKAEFTTAIFKFVDDVEFMIQEDGSVQVRSASRVGYSDLGTNGKRVEKIRQMLLMEEFK